MADVREALIAMNAAGIPTGVQARAMGLNDGTIVNYRRRLGLGGPERYPQHEPIDGEIWKDRPDLGVRVSTLGRFASLKTGGALRVTQGRRTRYITVRVGMPGTTTASVAFILGETFGTGAACDKRRYTPGEDALIRASRTHVEAFAALPHRPRAGVRKRALAIGHKLVRGQAVDLWAPVRGSVPYSEPIWAEAHEAVPRAWPQDVRDDLISDLVIMRLEGGAADMRAALKAVVRDRNRMMGTWRERSLDAVVAGTDGLRLIDTLASDCERI